MFECMEYGKNFENIELAELAVDDGCPVCGGNDIDLA